MHKDKKTRDDLQNDVHLAIRSALPSLIEFLRKEERQIYADEVILAGVSYMKENMGYSDAPNDEAWFSVDETPSFHRDYEQDCEMKSVLGDELWDKACAYREESEKKYLETQCSVTTFAPEGS